MIRITFLGGFKASQADRDLNIRGVNERSLLAYFCAEGDRVYARDYLATLLWPESGAQKARQNLRATLFKLRQNLLVSTDIPADALLTTSRQNIHPHFDENPELFWSDIGQFTGLRSAIQAHAHANLQDCPVCRPRMEAAADLYQGEFFHTISGADSRSFEDWLCDTQENLRQQVSQYLITLGQSFLEVEQFTKVIPYARQLIQIDPEHTAGQRMLQLALGSTGQHRAAAQAYEQYLEALQGLAPDEDLQDLYQRIQSRTSTSKKPPSPYLGLAAYTEQDADLFFGREAFLDLLENKLRALKFVVVIGDSGSGKSSLVQAGLIPHIRRQKPGNWAVLSMRPGADPQQALAEALLPPGEPKPAEGADPKTLLGEMVRETQVDHVLLVVDQFEEIFSQTTSPEVRVQFIEQLLSAPNCAASLHVVLTMRADFLSQAIQHRDLADAIQKGALLLGPMNQEEMRRAILRPAAQQGVEFAPGLVSRLLEAVRSEPSSLVLLQFTLTRLWEAMSGRLLTHGDYEAIGGLENALVQYAEDVFASFTANEQEQVKRICLRMIHSQANLPDTRRMAARDEFTDAEWQVVQQLADFRLVTTREDQERISTVEIVHEALLSHWGRLRDWLDENHGFRLWRARLQFLYRFWLDHDRDPQVLLSGPALLDAEKWQLTHLDSLSPEEINFITHSLARQEQQRAARAREADFGYSLSLANRAQLALHEGDTGTALTLAMEANQILDPPTQAELMLAEAAYAPGVRCVFQGHTGQVENLVVLPGGWEAALTASADGSLILWNLQTEALIRRFEGHEAAVHAVAVFPQGEQALSASGDGTLILWDLHTGAIIRRFSGHDGIVWDVNVRPGCDPDGHCQAISASEDGTLILWDVTSGDPIRRFEGHNGAVNSVAISADGSTALSGASDHLVIQWDIETGRILQTLKGQDWTESSDEEVPEHTLAESHRGPVREVIFGLDGRTAYSVSDDRQMISWDLETSRALRVDNFDASLLSLSLSSNGHYFLLGRADSQVILWSPYYSQVMLKLTGHTSRIRAVTFSPNGRQALSGSDDGTMRLWDLRSGAEMRSMIVEGSALDVDLNPEGDLLMLAGARGDISLWDQAGGREIRRLVGHTETPFAGGLFRPAAQGNGPLMAVSGAGDVFGTAKDNTLRLWNVETGEEVRSFTGHTNRLWDIDISADGRFAVSASHDGSVRLWDLDKNSGEVLADVSPQAARSVSVSPEGQTILVGLAKGSSPNPEFSLHQYDRESGELLQTFSGHMEIVSAVAFSPDGRTALSGGHDSLLILWNLETGQEIRRFVGHTGAVNKVAFSPAVGQSEAGRYALSAGLDNLIILWDVASGVALRIYRGHIGGVLSLVFAPDGESFWSVALDDTVRQWKLDPDLAGLLAWVRQNRHVGEISSAHKLRFGMSRGADG